MPEEAAYVIVGASVAGAKAAETLREEGFAGAIVLLGTELERPYERPPLSKGYLLGKADKASLYVHEEHWYADHGVDLRLGVTATAIDRAAGAVGGGPAVRAGPLALRPAAAGHRRPAAPAERARERPGRGALPAHRRRLGGAGHRAGRAAARTPGWSSSGRAGSGWRSPPRPGKRAAR